MLSLYRGLVAGILLAGLAALCMDPANVGAQDKKGKTAKEEVAERGVGITTSDGLSLKGYWFQGTAIEKNNPDAVIMVPAPGNKINDSWIWLAKALSEKNFSVLLFDWRGVGLNGPDGVGAGVGILVDKTRFWDEPYNGRLLGSSKATIERRGLEYSKIYPVGNSAGSYRDFMFMNDLLAARFFLDQENDRGKCNTNRVWIISEKEGSQLGMAFIATEFQRNTNYDIRDTIIDFNKPFKSAGKDYIGIMSLSYSGSNTTAAKIYRNALPPLGANQAVKDAKDHLTDQLAMVLMYKKGDGGPSRTLLNSVGATGSEADLKPKYKYPKEFDIKAMKPISGIDLVDPADTFKVREYVVTAMVEISKKNPVGKAPTDRQVSKAVYTPRFQAEKFAR